MSMEFRSLTLELKLLFQCQKQVRCDSSLKTKIPVYRKYYTQRISECFGSNHPEVLRKKVVLENIV